jgi:large subunit ribosomal protein L17
VITSARKGTPESFGATQSWLFNPRVTMPALHTILRERYVERPGGYARIHLTGSRVGDRADMAGLELVDGPGELRFEMLARKLGRKMYEEELCVASRRPTPPRAGTPSTSGAM